MKKIGFIVLSAMLILAIGAVGVFAADSVQQRTSEAPASSSSCIRTDENRDGICDNYDTKEKNTKTNSTGYGFIDEDNDGVCDRYTNSSCNGNGTGCGNGRGKNGFHGGCKR